MMKTFIDSCRTVYFNWFLWITHSNTYWFQNEITLAYFTREDKPSSAKPPFNSNSGLAVLRLTPLVKIGHIKLTCPFITQAGAALDSYCLATRRVTGGRPSCINWKCLRFWDTLILNNSTDTNTHGCDKLTWRAGSLYLQFKFGLSLLCVGTLYTVKWLLDKISVYAFTHHVLPMRRFSSHARTRDGCAPFRSAVMSSEVMWITWSPLWRSTHLPNSEIFIDQNNAFFIATAWLRYWDNSGLPLHFCACCLLCRCAWLPGEPKASSGKRKIAWSSTRYMALISTHRFSIRQKVTVIM